MKNTTIHLIEIQIFERSIGQRAGGGGRMKKQFYLVLFKIDLFDADDAINN